MKALFNTFVGAALLLAALPASAISLSVVSSSTGPAVSVAISVSGLSAGSAPSLGTYDLNLGFDPGILSYTGTLFGDPLLGDQLDASGLGSLALDTAGAGSINLFQLSLDLAADLELFQADAFTLAMLSFNSIALGTSSLDLTINAFGDALGDPFMDVNGSALVIDISNSSVTTTEVVNASVPEPAIWSLYGIGLLSMVWLRPRKVV